jgi:hypothetical protein
MMAVFWVVAPCSLVELHGSKAELATFSSYDLIAFCDMPKTFFL